MPQDTSDVFRQNVMRRCANIVHKIFHQLTMSLVILNTSEWDVCTSSL